jgi:hypothetical protein
LNAEDSKYEKLRVQKQSKKYYISNISARFNPDMIIGEALGSSNKTGSSQKLKLAQFLRGNEYFSY